MTEHIGIYRVDRPIGRGGMGEVFLAWDGRLERRVAIVERNTADSLQVSRPERQLSAPLISNLGLREQIE